MAPVQRCENCVQNGSNISGDFVVPEPQDDKTLLFQIGCSPAIVPALVVKSMLFAIGLDDQPMRQAAKIRNVRTYGDLPPEMRTSEWQTMAQCAPQELFRWRE